ncbi:MAG: hypothetical protein WD512_10820 [Candidatus Paceibacterota bacterium]
MSYIKIVVGIYYILSAGYNLLGTPDYVLVHSSSEYYLTTSILVFFLNAYIAWSLLSKKMKKSGVILGLVISSSVLGVTVVNLFVDSGMFCRIGFIDENLTSVLIQKAVTAVLLVLILKKSD